ncbi:MAG: hypothetical protein WCW16_00285 [Candidatus Magasanikbacteria bacterium]
MHIWLIESTYNGYAVENKKINWEHIESGYTLHTTHPVFAMRPLTNNFVYGFHVLFDIPIGSAIIIVHAFFLMADGLLLYILVRVLRFSHGAGIWSLLLFYLTFSIVFAFATNMHTYDEPVQYALLFTTLIFLFQKRYRLFSLSLFLSAVARETSLILIPGLCFLAYTSRDLALRPVLVSITIASMLYGAYYIGYGSLINGIGGSVDYLQEERFFEWHYNFQSIQYTKESIIMPFLVLFPWIIILFEYVRLKSKRDVHIKFFLWASILTVGINTPLTLYTARSQEARIFALPLIFVWPILGYIIHSFFVELKAKIINLLSYKMAAVVVLLFIIAGYISFVFFDPTIEEGITRYAYQAYMFAVLMIFIIYIALVKMIKRNKLIQ